MNKRISGIALHQIYKDKGRIAFALPISYKPPHPTFSTSEFILVQSPEWSSNSMVHLSLVPQSALLWSWMRNTSPTNSTSSTSRKAPRRPLSMLRSSRLARFLTLYAKHSPALFLHRKLTCHFVSAPRTMTASSSTSPAPSRATLRPSTPPRAPHSSHSET